MDWQAWWTRYNSPVSPEGIVTLLWGTANSEDGVLTPSDTDSGERLATSYHEDDSDEDSRDGFLTPYSHENSE